ncbi:MAG: pyrroline-5-carboxylate reductase [Pseudomonadales bacterium]
MARTLIRGVLAAATPPDRLRASDPMPAQRHGLAALGIATTDDNAAAAAGAGIVVLAVKPQRLREVLEALAPPPGQLVISIAAGVPLPALEAWTPPGTAIVRCMPNTPALLRAGITGLYANDAVTAEQRVQAETVLGAAGSTLWVEREGLLDAVTAVSGSGPAYFFYLMEAMIAAGEALGLDAESARRLTLETALGAARMACEGEDEPAVLRANVTSPGGTTERALSILDAADVGAAVRRAVMGAAERAEELAKEFGES